MDSWNGKPIHQVNYTLITSSPTDSRVRHEGAQLCSWSKKQEALCKTLLSSAMRLWIIIQWNRLLMDALSANFFLIIIYSNKNKALLCEIPWQNISLSFKKKNLNCIFDCEIQTHGEFKYGLGDLFTFLMHCVSCKRHNLLCLNQLRSWKVKCSYTSCL